MQIWFLPHIDPLGQVKRYDKGVNSYGKVQGGYIWPFGNISIVECVLRRMSIGYVQHVH